MLKSRYRNLLTFAYFAMICVWTFLVVGLWLVSTADNKSLYKQENNSVVAADFVKFYEAGMMTLKETSRNIYAPSVQLKWVNQIIQPLQISEPPFIEYSPVVFVLMAPFALLPIGAAFLIAESLAAVVAMTALWLLLVQNKALARKERILFLILVLSSYPAHLTFARGQLGWFLLASLSFYAWGYLKGKDFVSGISLAFMLAKPQYLPCLLLAPLAQRRFKMIAAFAVAELILVAICAVVLGGENVINYPRILFSMQHQVTAAATDDVSQFTRTGSEAPIMPSIRGVLSDVFPAGNLMVTLAVMAVSGLIFLYYFGLRKRQISRGLTHTLDSAALKTPELLALGLLLSIFLSPHIYYYDFVVLASVAAFTLPTLDWFQLPMVGSKMYRVWTVIFLSMPLLSWLSLCPSLFGSAFLSKLDARIIAAILFALILLVLRFCRQSESTFGLSAGVSSALASDSPSN